MFKDNASGREECDYQETATHHIRGPAQMTSSESKRQVEKASLAAPPVRLRFLGTGTIALKGAITGKPYLASESTREIDVDARDATEFLEHGVFSRA